MTVIEMTSEEFDKYFDDGGDITDFIVPGSIRQPNKEQASAVRKATYSFPSWVVDEAEREAKRVAISRSAVINMWVAEKAEEQIARRQRTARAQFGGRVA